MSTLLPNIFCSHRLLMYEGKARMISLAHYLLAHRDHLVQMYFFFCGFILAEETTPAIQRTSIPCLVLGSETIEIVS